MRTVVTGATGLIGRMLVPNLPGAVILSRDPGRAARELVAAEAHPWQPEAGPAPLEALRGTDAVFHLAGEPVAAGRWTPGRKRRIRESRIQGTRNLVAALAQLEERPEVLVSASAVGYYGDRGDQSLDEASPAGNDFLAQVCADWEREAMAAETLGIRVVCIRTGIVLAAGGGALARMLPPFRLGLGGRLGDGRQWMSWVHIDDVIGIMLHIWRNRAVRGPVNAVSPNPVTNADFTRALGRAVHRPAILPVPKAALRVVLGEMSVILTASQKVFPRSAERSHYAFKQADLDRALDSVVHAPAGEAAD
jgi:uncharacterized protein (TIGR01777 family)